MPRSTRWRRSPACDKASSWRSAGATSTSSTACSTSGATSLGPREGAEGQAGPFGADDAAVIDALAELKERERFTDDDDLVFTREGEHLDHYGLRKRYYEALERAGLRRLRFHDLRHCLRLRRDHEARPLRGPELHGPPALLDHPALPAPQAAREDAAKLAEAFERGTNRAPKRAQVEQLRTRKRA